MTMQKKFTGTGVALITPFNEDGSVDYNALEKLIEFNIAHGIQYFVSLGTTGESATLDAEEKRDIWKFTSRVVNGRVALMAGIGGNDTSKTAKEIHGFDVAGYDAILSVSPYYNRPSQEGIYRHYLALAKASALPLVLYNVPSRTGSNISADTVLRLQQADDKFIGVKEASGNFPQVMQILKQRKNNFLVISGDDIITLPLMSMQCDGVISVVAQAFPKQFSAMIAACENRDFSEAHELHNALMPFMEMFFAESSPAGVKAALHILGICKNVLRLPLVPVSDGLYAKIREGMQGM